MDAQLGRMGFGRAEAEAALAQAGNDIYVAIELALNGSAEAQGAARPVQGTPPTRMTVAPLLRSLACRRTLRVAPVRSTAHVPDGRLDGA